QPYTVGALVLANFGNSGCLTVGGDHIGRRIAKLQQEAEQGSIIIVIATDAPLNERQLERVAERSMVALGRTGSCCGNGSGDIALAFSTGNRYPHYSEQKILPSRYFHDAEIDDVFECAIEATEEAIISALYHAETTRGIRGNIVRGLRDYL
ncbi:MAG: P1 family peptidase, partial [Clostridiales bacterium]|nr:P1 family peptidase [Candidatus Apopatocola equi]